MAESRSLKHSPERLQELTAVLAQMGAVVLSAETIDTTIELVATLAATTIPNPAHIRFENSWLLAPFFSPPPSPLGHLR